MSIKSFFASANAILHVLLAFSGSLMDHSIQNHDCEYCRQVHVRVPKERACPLLRLFVPQAYREVDQSTAQSHSASQVEVAHRTNREEPEGDCKYEHRIQQDLPSCFRFTLDHGQHRYARLLVVFLDQ